MRALVVEPVRIVQFMKSFQLGGAQMQAVELLRGLSGIGLDVKVATLDESGPLLEEVWKLGHLPEEFPLHGSLAKPNTSVQVGRCALWLARNRIELVHVHDFHSSVVAVPAAKLAGAKLVIGRRSLSRSYGRARKALVAQLTRAGDHVIANAQSIKDSVIVEDGVPREKVSVIHGALDVAHFDACAARGLKSPLPDTGELPFVVLVANMDRATGRHEDLLAAIAEVNRDGARVHVFLVGDGPRRQELERQARELGVGKVAHFLGFRTDVPAILTRACVGVVTANHEGLSRVVAEGMAARLPMVVTHAGGSPELVSHDEQGLIVPPERPVEMARAIERLLHDAGLAQRMGKAGRQWVEDSLTVEALVRQHGALYRRLARGSAQDVTGPLAA